MTTSAVTKMRPNIPTTPTAPFSHKDIQLIQTTSLEIIHQTWSNSLSEWGKPYGAEKYFVRETTLASQPFACNGKQRFWILVPISFDPKNPNRDLILSSLETFERPGIIATKERGLRNVLSISIASVFTPEKHRGFGYASLMMKLLWKEIQEMETAEFTFLYSDIGPTFYSRMGWTPMRSEEIIAPLDTPSIISLSESVDLEYVTDHNLTQVLERDVQLLRESILERMNTVDPNTTVVAVTPEPDCINWLQARSRFTARSLGISQEGPNTIGVQDKSTDSFALWFHDFIHNELYIIRWRVDTKAGEGIIHSMLHGAREEARKWKLSKIIIWNPDQSVVDIIGLEVVKRGDSISSLGMAIPGHETKNIEWVINEKYGWC